MERWEIVIVGAGAAGLMAACAAAQTMKSQGRAPSVLLLEGNPKPGKKLLATGNGRCNLTNLQMGAQRYHGDREGAALLLENYPPDRILDAFSQMGLLCQADGEGRVYPRSLQAAAVLQALESFSREAGAALRCGWGVSSLARGEGGFRLENQEGESLLGNRVILACGGKASPKHSWEGGGYSLAQQLGHRVTGLRPSLTYVKSGGRPLGALKGMRVRARVSLVGEGKPLWEERGEVLFNEGALSGICLFNLSAQLEGAPQGAQVSLDLFPELSYREVLSYLQGVAKAHPERLARELFSGAVNLRVAWQLAKELGFPAGARCRDLALPQLRRAASLARDWRFPAAGTGGWESAQVTRGGVPLREVDIPSMESKKCPGLFLAGEMLNVDGDCGGYNLHWAWSTGLAAGSAAAGRKRGG